MTPVINPWVFYAISVVDKLKTFLVIIIFFVAVIGLTYSIGAWIEEEINKRFIKILIWIVGVCMAVVIVVPGSETITKMIVAQNVTYERVEAATDVVQNVYNDIMELFEKETT